MNFSYLTFIKWIFRTILTPVLDILTPLKMGLVLYYTEDPFLAPLTDQFNGLASDQNSSEKIFYATYHSFDSRDREYGLGTYRWMLMKIDLENMTIKEKELADAWNLLENPKLIPQVKGDTVSFLIREKDENLYLKRLIFD